MILRGAVSHYLEQAEDEPLLERDGVRVTDSALADGDIIMARSRDVLTGGDAALLDTLAECCRCN